MMCNNKCYHDIVYPYTDITNNIQTAVAAEIPSDDLSADMESDVQLSSSATPNESSQPLTTVSTLRFPSPIY